VRSTPKAKFFGGVAVLIAEGLIQFDSGIKLTRRRLRAHTISAMPKFEVTLRVLLR
jgi:hypothetical protein